MTEAMFSGSNRVNGVTEQKPFDVVLSERIRAENESTARNGAVHVFR